LLSQTPAAGIQVTAPLKWVGKSLNYCYLKFGDGDGPNLCRVKKK